MQPTPRLHRSGLAFMLLLALGARAQGQTPGVGIGTTAPDARAALDVVSSSKGALLPRLTAAARAAIAAPVPAGLLVYQTDGAQPGFWYYAATGGWTFLSPVGDNLGNHTATQNLNLGANLLTGNGGSAGLAITSGGSVGLGTSSPVTQLSNSASNVIGTDGNGVSSQALNWVSPTTGYAAGLANTNAAANGHGLAVKVASANAGTAALDISQGTLASPGSSLLRVRGDGQVGVGTASPTQRLDVEGGILARGSSPISNQGAHLQWNRTGGAGETWLLNQRGGGGGGIRFGAATTANAVTEWARFEGDGRLGIGTTNPAGQLDVYGLPGFGTAVADQGVITPTGYFYINPGNTAAQSFTAGASGQLQQLQLVVAGDNGGLLEPSDLRVEVYAGASASGTVLASATQNVPEQFIAPPLPTTFTFAAPAVLVSGQSYSFRLSRVSGAPGIRGYVNRNVYAGGNYLGEEPQFDQAFLTFMAPATAARSALVVRGSNVGIGTTSPGQALDVSGNAAISGNATVGGNQTVGGNSSLSGSLGLGTSSPSQKLDVRGNLRLGDDGGNAGTGQAIEWVGPGVSSDPVGIYRVNTATDQSQLRVVVGDSPDANDKFVVGRTSAGTEGGIPAGTFTPNFTVRSDGNVGIGTTAPTQRLEVDGGLLARGNGAINTQGAHLQWNRIGGAGETWLINQQGGGAGGIFFGKADQSNNVTEWARFDSNGNLGVGGASPGQRLYVNGAICSTVGLNCTSDGRYKRDVTPVQGALASVLKLRGVTYYWKQAEFPDKQFEARRQLGFIAQEIEPFYPEMVSTDQDGYKSVDYSRLTPVLVEALKEQQAQIETLKQQAAAAKAQATASTEAFEARLRALEAGAGRAYPAGQARK